MLDLGRLPVNLNSQIEPSRASDVAEGPIAIVVCTACSHLYNAAFDPALIAYDAAYENTLHFSPRFQRYANELAARLMADHGLVGKTVLEVGCGPGHFLSMLCEHGAGRGLGFDPSFDPERLGAPRHAAVTIEAEPLAAGVGGVADLAYSQQVLEHLEDPVALLRLLGSVVEPAGAVFCEVPNGKLMMEQIALWDLLYEHVSYFTPVSLEVAVSRAGMAVLRRGASFGDQFLWVDAAALESNAARDRSGGAPDWLPSSSVVEPLVDLAVQFGQRALARVEEAGSELDAALARGPVALWGAGTKGMTYLNLVKGAERIAAVVDINPRKRGFGVPGTSLQVMEPADLVPIRPLTVLIANPIYRHEIGGQLRDLGLISHVVPLWDER